MSTQTLSIVGLPFSDWSDPEARAIILVAITDTNTYTLCFVPEPDNKFERIGIAVRVDIIILGTKRIFKLGYLPSRSQIARNYIVATKQMGNEYKICSPENILKQTERFSSIVIAPVEKPLCVDGTPGRK